MPVDFNVQLRRGDDLWRNHPLRNLPCCITPRFFAVDVMHAVDLGISRDIGLQLLGTMPERATEGERQSSFRQLLLVIDDVA